MEHATLHVEVSLQHWGSVNAGGAGSGAGQGGSRLGNVAEGVVNSRLEELDVDESELVVEALELAEETIDKTKGFVVRLLGHVEVDETDLEVLALEGSTLGGSPFYAVFGHGNLDFGAVGNVLKQVEQLTDYVTKSVIHAQRLRASITAQKSKRTQLCRLSLGERRED
jgi:hypothetical protein